MNIIEPKNLIGPLMAIAGLLITSNIVVAQSQSPCNPDGTCAGGTCQISPGGIGNVCNCCALGGGFGNAATT